MTETEYKNYEKACDEIFGKENRMEIKTTAKCLICQKNIVFSHEEHNSFEGGDVVISFGYGSRYDQMGWRELAEVRNAGGSLQPLLSCDKIYARICDDCFEKVAPLMEGYMLKAPEEERVV